MPLLGTKLRGPAPRRQLVARDRLVGRLPSDPATMPRLVLVSAPPGFGKTTLLTQWLAPGAADDRGHARTPPRQRVAWLSLDAADAEPRTFLIHLVAALQVASPEVGVDALAMMDTDRPLPTEEVVASLVNDLDALAGATVIALADYHAADSPSVHEAVGLLLDNLPPQVTVAMTTRADPPLPLSRMRARGELLEVRSADLRFTTEEAAAFLNTFMDLDLAAAQVAALEARTEGWAAGLQLAALSMQADAGDRTPDRVASFVAAFTGSHRFVLDYLLEGVLAGQSEDVRTFLLDTSILEQLSAPLCDALSGRTDAQTTLEMLERRNPAPPPDGTGCAVAPASRPRAPHHDRQRRHHVRAPGRRPPRRPLGRHPGRPHPHPPGRWNHHPDRTDRGPGAAPRHPRPGPRPRGATAGTAGMPRDRHCGDPARESGQAL
jgi:LuxR family maltose regulon positive regulatory protein